jgi:hypothetical protein
MTNKQKLTRKDSFTILLGVFLGFILQVAYDVAHELAYIHTEPINLWWLVAQFCYIAVGFFIASQILKQIPSK